MKKRIITALLALLLLFSLVLPATAAEEKSEAQTAAETLYGYGLMLGVGTGADGSPDFALDNKLSREEAVTLLVRLLGAEDEAENGDWSCPFSDVSGWAEGYVGYAWAKGLTKGIGGGLFGAASDVTASQFITFVLRALGYSSETDFVWDSAWTLSDALGVTDGRYNAGTGDFLRGDAAIVSLGAVLACPKGESRTLLEILQSAPALSMEVHFIDVGQADCILVESDGEYMLVDAGNNADSELVVDYLRDEGVTTLDYLIGTHPHEDHIGGLDAVINAFEVETLIMPDVTTTTKTFEDVLDAIEANGLSVTLPEPGAEYALGDGSFTIIAPVSEYGNELNDWSVGIRLVCGDTSFVMCGDAEALAESDITERFPSLASDVLKLGHHGSRTSTSDGFLAAVSPTWAVISCGEGNSYGHPHEETLDKLAAAGVSVFRTDLQGTIIAKSDGRSISWNVSPAA